MSRLLIAAVLLVAGAGCGHTPGGSSGDIRPVRIYAGETFLAPADGWFLDDGDMERLLDVMETAAPSE